MGGPSVLSTPSLGITGYRPPERVRKTLPILSTPSLGITAMTEESGLRVLWLTLSTPSLGITGFFWTLWRGAAYLQLSTPSLGITEELQQLEFDLAISAFNSLSRDHGENTARAVAQNRTDAIFQFPLSGSQESENPGKIHRLAVLFLSTPSLGITGDTSGNTRRIFW